MSGIFLVVNVALLTYFLVITITGASGPAGLLIAVDHSMFIGVMSNALFGLIQDASQEQRSFWPWADDILFWGMNIGITGFLVALLSGVKVLESIFPPIMGLSILLGILTYFLRLNRLSKPGAVEVQVRPS